MCVHTADVHASMGCLAEANAHTPCCTHSLTRLFARAGASTAIGPQIRKVVDQVDKVRLLFPHRRVVGLAARASRQNLPVGEYVVPGKG